MNTRPTINLGLCYAYPYESRYAVLRRCLATNPGLSLSTIERFLRETRPEEHSTLERLLLLHTQSEPTLAPPLSGLLGTKTYERQCPRCAEELYHSPIYALPWLSHCPIHHCALSTTCPRCQQPWPAPQSLSTRDCPTCGRPSRRALVRQNAHLDLRPIADLYRFLTQGPSRLVMGTSGGPWQTGLTDSCWVPMSLASSLYPASQALCNPILSDTQLDRLHVIRLPVRRKTARLLPVIDSQKAPVRVRGRDPLCLDLARSSPQRLLGDFRVMLRILAWTARQGHRHPVRITSYRYRQTYQFVDAPDFCPYCLALSLWFLHTARQRYGLAYAPRSAEYPFFEHGDFRGFYDFAEPRLYVEIGAPYRLDGRFNGWFYRKSLEISYAELIHASFDWLRRVQHYRRGGRPRHYRSRPRPLYLDRAHLYSAVITNGDLAFYYETEHPLEHYRPDDLNHPSDECEVSHRHDLDGVDPDLRLLDALEPEAFTYERFLELHNHLRAYLRGAFDP